MWIVNTSLAIQAQNDSFEMLKSNFKIHTLIAFYFFNLKEDFNFKLVKSGMKAGSFMMAKTQIVLTFRYRRVNYFVNEADQVF